MNRKHSTEEIQQFAQARGCELLSEYKNAHSKITVKCRCGTIYETRWNDFRDGKSCKSCGYKKAAVSRKTDIDLITAKFKEAGCRLIGSYENNHKPVQYQCVCGRESQITFANFQNGHRCRHCRSNNMSGDKHHNWEPDRTLLQLRRQIRSRSYAAIKRLLQKTAQAKQQKSELLLGFTQQELLVHITGHQSWKSIKDRPWHIDHIFPVKAFLEHGIRDLKLINCLENLRPLPATDNIKKNAKYDKTAFEKWIKTKE